MENCLFCKIIAGSIPARIVFEDEQFLAIEDITPQAPLHLLLIPKCHFANLLDMTAEHDALVGHILRSGGTIARDRGYGDGGFRIVQNNGTGAGQSVFHLHFHLLAGRDFSWPPG